MENMKNDSNREEAFKKDEAEKGRIHCYVDRSNPKYDGEYYAGGDVNVLFDVPVNPESEFNCLDGIPSWVIECLEDLGMTCKPKVISNEVENIFGGGYVKINMYKHCTDEDELYMRASSPDGMFGAMDYVDLLNKANFQPEVIFE